METKINNTLKEHGLTVEDLTQDELEQLTEELMNDVDIILDGVLSNPEIFYRRAMVQFKEEE